MAEIPDSIYLHPASDLDIFTREPGECRIEYHRVRTCAWTLDPETWITGGQWHTACGMIHEFPGGDGPDEHRHGWCPYCGGEIEIKE